MLGQVLGLDLDGEPAVVSEAGNGQRAESNAAVDVLLPLLGQRPVRLVELERLDQGWTEPFFVLAYEVVKKVDRRIGLAIEQVPRSDAALQRGLTSRTSR
jgi:hypothetical protein